MKLVDMKMSDEEKAEYAQPTALSDNCEYPYGLQISLNDEAVSKLFKSLPAVGSELMVTAKVSVCSTSNYERDGQEPEQSVQLQITQMAVAKSGDKQDPATKLYGEND